MCAPKPPAKEKASRAPGSGSQRSWYLLAQASGKRGHPMLVASGCGLWKWSHTASGRHPFPCLHAPSRLHAPYHCNPPPSSISTFFHPTPSLLSILHPSWPITKMWASANHNFSGSQLPCLWNGDNHSSSESQTPLVRFQWVNNPCKEDSTVFILPSLESCF